MTMRRWALVTLTCAAAIALAGCAQPSTGNGRGADGVGGMGSAPGSAPPANPSNDPPNDQAGDGGDSGGPAPNQPGPNQPGATTSGSAGPQVVYLRVKQKPQCPQGTNKYPVPGVPLILEWKVTGARQVAVSVDDPHRVGSYGTYDGQQGSETFTFGCGGKPNSVESHTYTIYTVGSGPQRSRSITVRATVYEIGRV